QINDLFDYVLSLIWKGEDFWVGGSNKNFLSNVRNLGLILYESFGEELLPESFEPKPMEELEAMGVEELVVYIGTTFVEKELDYVDIVLPTYLHAPVAIKAMKKGFNVFCEKPMALNAAECKKMIETSAKTGKKLMIGQCLRFWGEYEYLKNCVSDGRYGNVISAYFFRGGGTPLWSFENWLLCREKGGGGLHDQHVHDVDMVQYLFGMPQSLSTSGKIVYEGSGYDCCSTNYFYEDGKVVNVQNDWTINGEFGFDYNFRVNFEKGSIILKDGKLTVYPHEGEKFEPDFDKESAYYKEIVYFANCVRNDLPVEMSTPESCAKTIDIVCTEAKSADNNGKQIKLTK
ncbi:MAG: Gfo/Idh/MocA family oxidoreductase, partial [Ruminococcaceae bacterium]|nr:Gfo/Idh/MocA family oxidoreductase [Oscillospiraceae bacterium]